MARCILADSDHGEEEVMTRLWEVTHEYYCEEVNYYNANTTQHFESWEDFFDETSDEDMDYNLVFRFDWHEGDDYDLPDYSGDDTQRCAKLWLFYMNQRKGLFRSVSVDVCRNDEPAVVAWLQPRFKHMMKLWAPLKLKVEVVEGMSTPVDAREAAGQMYHEKIRPMVALLSGSWENLTNEHKSLCVADAMDIVTAWRLKQEVKPRPMNEAPTGVELRVYGEGLPIEGRSFVRMGDVVEMWTRTDTTWTSIENLPPSYGWLYMKEAVK